MVSVIRCRGSWWRSAAWPWSAAVLRTGRWIDTSPLPGFHLETFCSQVSTYSFAEASHALAPFPCVITT